MQQPANMMDGRVNRNRPHSVHVPHANGDIGQYPVFFLRLGSVLAALMFQIRDILKQIRILDVYTVLRI
jgi:hypothetical protein